MHWFAYKLVLVLFPGTDCVRETQALLYMVGWWLCILFSEPWLDYVISANDTAQVCVKVLQKDAHCIRCHSMRLTLITCLFNSTARQSQSTSIFIICNSCLNVSSYFLCLFLHSLHFYSYHSFYIISSIPFTYLNSFFSVLFYPEFIFFSVFCILPVFFLASTRIMFQLCCILCSDKGIHLNNSVVYIPPFSVLSC